jgi:hypothetical protein
MPWPNTRILSFFFYNTHSQKVHRKQHVLNTYLPFKILCLIIQTSPLHVKATWILHTFPHPTRLITYINLPCGYNARNPELSGLSISTQVTGPWLYLSFGFLSTVLHDKYRHPSSNIASITSGYSSFHITVHISNAKGQ